ncbi:hypothetical protein PMI30_04677 [Pseudomonas sp. GM50]|uniref:hypothetical protein n=1 Tax=Pseudomonas sp. GM50 TaxID=1144332 RepID=UPI000270A107|nr:hypothetical protein [Pseudomonas sp. GM50]EJM62360.1 hypothetical protein PMI30_04677 [Pseudomonas sp. GM50]
MSPVSSKKSRSFYVPQSADFSHEAVSSVSVRTEDGRSVVMTLGDSHHQLSARQADAIAQGLLMSVLRTDLEITNMPWDGGCHLNVASHNGDRAALRFPDDTLYHANATFRYFGMCWLFEGTGEDPDYPANVLCVRTLHDGGILFGKGNDKYLLSAQQALQLCHDLSGSAYSLENRSWRVWDKMIDWQARSDADVTDQTPEERALLNHLKSYKICRKAKRNAR